MGNRVYVGNLSYGVSSEDLKQHFAKCGSVTDARVMTDRESGQSRGFGFVTFSTDADAKSAIDILHGQDMAGRNLVVNEARERENRGGGPRMSDYGGPGDPVVNGRGRDDRGGGRGSRRERD